jgi:hypothetical protein
MKKVLLVATALMMVAGIASVSQAAFSVGYDEQEQNHQGGGFMVAGPASGPGGAAFIDGHYGTQSNLGFGLAGRNGEVNESQFQAQGYVGQGAGTGPNFAVTYWANPVTGHEYPAPFDGDVAKPTMTQTGTLNVDNRRMAIYGGEQTQVFGAAGVSLGGTYGIAGSGYYGTSEATAWENDKRRRTGSADANVENWQGVNGGYEIQSVGGHGYINQQGVQMVSMTVGADSSYKEGTGRADGSIIQVGGSEVFNDGQGGAMNGSITAATYATSDASGKGYAGIAATQTHSYSQANNVGGNFQYAEGSVTTSVTSFSDGDQNHQ